MKKVFPLVVFTFLALFFFSQTVFAKYVQGYTRKDGTYVNGYNRSESNSTVQDNYSHKGNTNPYTGEQGSNYNRNSPSSDFYGTQPRRGSAFGSSYGDSDRY